MSDPYYERNRALVIARTKAWRQANPERARELARRAYTRKGPKPGAGYYEKNKEKIKQRARDWYAKNPERVKARSLARRQRSPEIIAKGKADWVSRNVERKATADAAWRQRNPGRVNAHGAARRAREIQATPEWLTDEQRSIMALIYECAAAMTKHCGDEYQVDHIVPLKGRTVCGLHVPWNLQILTKKANRQKGNRL